MKSNDTSRFTFSPRRLVAPKRSDGGSPTKAGHVSRFTLHAPHSTLVAFTLLALTTVSPAAQFKFPSHTFTVPDGFEVELVAAPPLVDRPVSMDFDEQGRLYVTTSSGSNDKVQKQLEDKPHRILRLEDSDGDGRWDRLTDYTQTPPQSYVRRGLCWESVTKDSREK